MLYEVITRSDASGGRVRDRRHRTSATPMSVMVAAGRGASAGVLFRNAEAIEVLRQCDTLVVDKTGTLTEGRPRLTLVQPAANVDERELLRMASYNFV